MSDEIPQSLWNLDGAEHYTLFKIKEQFISFMEVWDLENAFWKVRLLRMEFDAALDRGIKRKVVVEFEKETNKDKKKIEKVEVDEGLSELEKARKEYNEILIQSQESKTKYYLALEKFYMLLCYLIKKHGIYFREGEDSQLAVLRR